MPRALVAACVIVIASGSSSAVVQGGAGDPLLGGGGIAVFTPTVEGLPGNATDSASGIRDLIVSFLTGPSLKVIPLEARLPSQAVLEAKQKARESILFAKVSRKSGGGGRATGRLLARRVDESER